MPAATYWRFTILGFGYYTSTSNPPTTCYLSELQMMNQYGGTPISDVNIVAKTTNAVAPVGSLANLNDNNDTTYFGVPASEIPGVYIQYQFDAAYDIKEFRLFCLRGNGTIHNTPASIPTSWKLEYSTDGISWAVAHQATDVAYMPTEVATVTDGGDLRYIGLIGVSNTWLLVCHNTNTANARRFAEVSLMQGGTNIAATASVYATSEASAANSAAKLIDNDVSTYWEGAGGGNTDVVYFITNLTSGNPIDSYSITAANLSTPGAPERWYLLQTNDGVDYSIVDYRSQETFTQGQARSFSVGNVSWMYPLVSNFGASGTTLTTNDRTLTATVSTRPVPAAALLRSEKWYWEVDLGGSFVSTDLIRPGLAYLVGFGYHNTSGRTPFIHYRSDGAVYRDDVLIMSGLPTLTAGDRLGVAYDATLGRVWFSKNGAWIYGDPGTGVSPVTTVPTGFPKSLIPVVYVTHDQVARPISFTFYDGSTSYPFSGTVPSGFRPINQSATINLQTDLVSSAALTDSYTYIRDVAQSFTSTGALTEALTTLFTTTGTMQVSSMSITDSFIASGTLYVSADSSIVASDGEAPVLEVTRTITDSAQVTESMSIAAVLQAAFSSTLIASVPVLLGSELYEAWVMNVDTHAMSRYDGFNFNSMARLGDKYYAAGAAGIVELSGSKDDTSSISASLITGREDFRSELLKRVKRAYLSGTSDGKLELRVVRDDNSVDTYVSAGMLGSEPSKHGVSMGRGARAHYWQFELRNKDGADFSVEKIEAIPVLLTRRVR